MEQCLRMAKTVGAADHVDKFLASIRDELPPELDLTVEGIVDRITRPQQAI